MTEPHDSATRLDKAPMVFGRAAAGAVLVMSALNWVGWTTGREWLTQLSASWPQTTPWTAMLLAALGAAIVLQSGRPSKVRARIGCGSAIAAGVLSLMFLAEYATGRSFGLDQVWFPQAVHAFQETWPGRPSPRTASSVALLSLAVGLAPLDRRWATTVRTIGLSAASVLPLIAVVAYLFSVVSLVGLTRSTGMGLSTALAVLLLVSAAILTCPDRNPVAWLLARPDRWTLIRLATILAALPVAVGFSRLVFLGIGLEGDAAWVLSITVGAVVVGVAALLSSQREQRTLIEKERLSDRLRLLVDNLPALIGYWDHEQRNVVANHAYGEFFGRVPSEVHGLHMREVLGESLYARNLPHIEGVLAGEEQHFDRTLIDQRGAPRYTQTSYIPDVADGAVRGFYVLVTDVSARVKAELERTEAQARYRILAENAVDVVVHLRDSHIVWISPSVQDAFGEPTERWIGSDILTHIHPDDRDAAIAGLQQIAFGEAAVVRLRIVTAQGDFRWVEARGKPYIDDAGNVDGVTGSMRIIDDQVEAERQLTRLAQIDTLTGLANRRETMARLEAALADPRNPGPELGVLFCDIDHFKTINDTWGHAAGDVVLSTTADRIRECVRRGDVVGRIGGDEILVQLTGVHDIDEVTHIAEKIRCRACEPIRQSGRSLDVTLSIGATLAVPGESVTELTARVDAAMYRAKRAGRNSISRI